MNKTQDIFIGTKFNSSTIPMLRDEVEIIPFDSKTYLVQQNFYKYQLRVNESLHDVLSLIDGKNNLETISQKLKSKYENINDEQLINILYKGKLVECGIILTDEIIVHRKSDAYLKLRFTLLKSDNIKVILAVLSFLFSPFFFWISMILMMLFIGYIFIIFININSIFSTVTPENSLIVYCFFYFSTLIHELGHASACKYFGAKPGNIGFGFYLFMPVFFADVSDAWRVSSRNRVIIDLAGLYMELFLCTFLCLFFLLSNDYFFICISLMLMLRTYGNLNPFLRFDGYWALSDGLNIPNLREKSNDKLLQAFGWIFKKKNMPVETKKDVFLLFYALCSQSMIMFFIFSVLIINPNSIIYFPSNLFKFLTNIFVSDPQGYFSYIRDSLVALLPAAILYFLLFRFIYNVLNQNVKMWYHFRMKKLRDAFKGVH